MKPILTIFFFAAVHVASAQVGIGTTTPALSAQLEILSSDKGILIPRVTLANRPGSPGKTTPVEGLLVYQTDNDPGFYYFDGTNWDKIVKKTDRPSNSFIGKSNSQAITVSSATPIEFNLTNLSSDITADSESNASRFTVQTSGLYQIAYSLRLQNGYPVDLVTSAYLLPSDGSLATRLYIASLDQTSIPLLSKGTLKGQATVQLNAGTSLELVVQVGYSLTCEGASLSITKL